MKKTLFKLSVILVILPATFDSSEKTGCNKAKQTSDKETEVKQNDYEENNKESKTDKNANSTFHLS